MKVFMKKRAHVRALGLVLALACALTVYTPVLAEDDDNTARTTAVVTFIDGALEMDNDIAGSGLDFDFGEHVIPAVRATYQAENAVEGVPVNHVLQVEDARYNSGDWHVTVELSAFSTPSELDTSSFDAIISLQGPSVANANPVAGTDGLSVETNIRVASQDGGQLVMAADDTLPRGRFTASWDNEDVAMEISHSEVTNIGVASYTATLTWTLHVGP